MSARNLLSILDLARDEIAGVLQSAETFLDIGQREIKKVPTLRGRTVVNLFYENSTRTRVSFEVAAKRLSADVVNVTAQASSVQKGESLKDTARTLLAMGADAIVLRHPSAGAPALLARWVDASVINAGDGAHEHPTQAVLDMFTVHRHFGTLDGLHVGIVGDVAHSRVARSDALGFRRMGARVTFVAPPTLVPLGVEAFGCDVVHDFDTILPSLDVVYMLRLQQERGTGAFLPSQAEFIGLYGLSERRAERLRDGAVVMHPGPMNRGVEIAAEVAESPRALIEDQVTSGVAVRMALLYLLLGSRDVAEIAS
jgi:aspartate carbamoyltransferase catalytic subunit